MKKKSYVMTELYIYEYGHLHFKYETGIVCKNGNEPCKSDSRHKKGNNYKIIEKNALEIFTFNT